MQAAIVMGLSLLMGAGAALAQVAAPPPPTTGAITKSDAKALAAKKTAEGIAECMKLWDSGTHMTKSEWARTCRRIQTRLENLKINGTMGLPKSAEGKKGNGG
jgi:hypothetical protein